VTVGREPPQRPYRWSGPPAVARALTLVCAALFAIGFVVPAAAAVALALSVSAGATMTMARRAPAALAWRRRHPHPFVRDDLWWNAQAFSFLLGGPFLAPAVLWPGTWAAVLLLGACLALALMSALTPFCLGRLMYVVLFERRSRAGEAG